MCGIVGVVRAGGVQPEDRDRVAKAVEALRHRGPDGNGVHAEAKCVLGHTRLSIVDVAGGAQPMRNEDDSVVAVYNGEIWNHLELRRRARATRAPVQRRGVTPRSSSTATRSGATTCRSA